MQVAEGLSKQYEGLLEAPPRQVEAHLPREHPGLRQDQVGRQVVCQLGPRVNMRGGLGPLAGSYRRGEGEEKSCSSLSS